MKVIGTMNKERVQGVGCFDREVFDKLLLPGEAGWTWRVAWLADGRTDLRYVFHDGENATRTMIPCCIDGLENQFEYLDFPQAWPKNDLRKFGYEESYGRILDQGKQIGSFYMEVVGHDGTPNL